MKATIGERGQLTIPKPVRDSLGLRPGQRMDVLEEEGRIIISKDLSDDPVSRVYGTLKVPPGWDTDRMIDEMRGPVDLPPES